MLIVSRNKTKVLISTALLMLIPILGQAQVQGTACQRLDKLRGIDAQLTYSVKQTNDFINSIEREKQALTREIARGNALGVAIASPAVAGGAALGLHTAGIIVLSPAAVAFVPALVAAAAVDQAIWHLQKEIWNWEKELLTSVRIETTTGRDAIKEVRDKARRQIADLDQQCRNERSGERGGHRDDIPEHDPTDPLDRIGDADPVDDISVTGSVTQVCDSGEYDEDGECAY